jgi:hypothetical protein
MPVNFIPSIALCAKWGNIDGDIESQSDLNNKFSQKADTAHNHNSQYEPKNSNIQNHINSTSNPHNVTKAQIGLANVENKSSNEIIAQITETNIPINMSPSKISKLNEERTVVYKNTISDTINNDNKLSFVSNHTIVITLNSIISNNNNLYSDYFIGIDEGFEYKLILINSNLASTFTMNSNVINNVASNSFNLPANKSVEISIIKIANKLRYMFSNEMGV